MQESLKSNKIISILGGLVTLGGLGVFVYVVSDYFISETSLTFIRWIWTTDGTGDALRIGYGLMITVIGALIGLIANFASEKNK